ncbi:MAG: AAA family ATPase [Opitutales bacterium]
MADRNEQTEELKGVLERIVYTNEENHYTVGELSVESDKSQVTVAGVLPGIQCGETLKIVGSWQRHPQHGPQFKIVSAKSELPASAWGIRRYLGSGLVPGIGPKYADKIVDHFGADTLTIISEESGRLREVEGIGKERCKSIKKAWDSQRAVREAMVFLQAYGITNSQCVRLVKKYGDSTTEILKENPYRIVREIERIGFKTADKIALNMGVGNEHPYRVEAGILHNLRELEDEGHTRAEAENLASRTARMLQIKPEVITQQMKALVKAGILVDLKEHGLQSKILERYETDIINGIRAAIQTPSPLPEIIVDKAVEWAQAQAGFAFAEHQSAGVKMALQSKLMVLTGGPGTGKTTILRAVVKILLAKKVKIALASPTGRAAQRLSESCDYPASTIHRLLKTNPEGGGFVHNADNPLVIDYLIIDEASMLDTWLTYSLVKALPPTTHLLLVGDTDQLPSVGAGHVLHDLLSTPESLIPRTRLTTIFRQGEESDIVTTAHRILASDSSLRSVANLASEIDWERDFQFILAENGVAASKKLNALIKDVLPEKLGVDPVADVQVLSPMYKGETGIDALNTNLQESLNSEGADTSNSGGQNKVWTQRHFREQTGRAKPRAIRHGSRTFRGGDKVIQLRNNYEKQVYNGDLGMIESIAPDGDTLVAEINGQRLTYERGDLSEIDHAFAISIHKSQGSEYPVVIIPLLKQHYIMLQRNLIYTAITRGRKHVFVIGNPDSWKLAVDRAETTERLTGLSIRLRSLSRR